MTVYGDLDVSVIDELPPGRKPIKTMHFFENNRKKVYDFMRKEIEIGRQIYMVYPLISESEKMDFKNLEEGYKHIKTAFPEPKYHVSMVHGRMRPADKDAEMMRFKNGETNIMVATTVIEVGVDVPNASVMVIESTERFGLSQLHQLRGRVGRGAEQSFCILMSKYKLGAESRKRIETMVATNDGFEIAEADMKLRGPGDIEGTQQSGMAFDMKIANIAKDGQILQYARDIATDILDDDPTLAKPENNLMRKQLIALRKNHLNWSSIS
jgi:ATP-dependent DNA helicase RecG